MTNKFLFFLGLIFLGFSVSSCNKGCELPDNSNSGDIIPGAIIFAGNTGGVPTVHHSEVTQYDIKVSFDNGYTYVPVDWNKYSVLSFPVTAGCNTYFNREVDIRPSTQSVKYKISVESCPDCENEYTSDNWVLVKKFPSNYAVNYEKKVL